MAAARKLESLNENFLTCSICTEGYTDPCTLTCGHTFCKGCLGKFLKTRQDAIRAKSILCPYCRQMTRAPRPDRPVEEWVKQIKPSFLIQGLLDTFGSEKVTDEDGSEKLCASCTQLGDGTEATSLCQDCDVILCTRCSNIHTSLPVTRHHVIEKLGEDIKGSGTGKGKILCKEHNELVNFCCKDCNTSICQTCCIISHRRCESVVTMKSMMSEMRSALEDNKDKICRQLERTRLDVMDHQRQTERINLQKASTELEIKQVTQEAMDVIKQKEKQLLEELNEMTEKQSGQLRGRIKSGEIVMQMYQQHIEYITQVLKSGSETEMFGIYQMCQSGTIEAVVKADVNLKTDVLESQIRFVKHCDALKYDKDIILGRIEHLTYDTVCQLVLRDTIDIRIHSDKETPYPADVTVLVVHGVETLVVTDYNNKSLKSFYTKKDKPRHSKLDFSSAPHSVTRVRDNQVAVSFWSHNEIVIVQVTPDLVLRSRVKTKKKYRGLTALSPSTLAAGCWDPPCVDILDVSWRVIRTVSRFNSGKNLICNPGYLCPTDSGTILVSDSGSGCVYCITPEGDVVFTYTPTGERGLGSTQGITTTSTGHILVAEYLGHKVILLTPAGEFVRDLLTSQDGIRYLCSLMFCDCKLYVVEYNGNVVKVFNCSIPQ
ncbi:E3 ubiquitin-protein ligase TRIM33-like [Haliotis cracherodii]|uniref:E3 ubiquitin-protein ligase TRIM33-like n=1 Tax=Haliotis cracherodii TaxID=6455 RepID=UPI0039E89B4B